MGERLGIGTGATSHLKKENLGKIIDIDTLMKTRSEESLADQPSPQDDTAVYS